MTNLMTTTVSLWGRGLDRARLPRTIHVRVRPDDTVEDAIVRSLERRSGLVVCGGPRWEGTALDRGQPVGEHYACTLGRPVRGAGFTPVAEVWYSVPISISIAGRA